MSKAARTTPALLGMLGQFGLSPTAEKDSNLIFANSPRSFSSDLRIAYFEHLLRNFGDGQLRHNRMPLL
jgi:hypothetical protein